MDDAKFEAARAAFVQGLAALEAGRLDAAEAAFRCSLAQLPGRPSTLNNLAITLLRQGRAAEALPLLDQLLAAEPDNADALGHRALAMVAAGRLAEAGTTLERLITVAPLRAEGWFHHAELLRRLGQPERALASYERCLALAAAHVEALNGRGNALESLGRIDEAKASFERAIALGADEPLARFHLACLDGRDAPAAAPPSFVEGLFDDYAADFDRHLLDTLEYRVPERMAQMITAAGARRFASALDLGCGTGLAAAPLVPLVDELHGVDLSAQMLDKARARGLYASLERSELVAHLQGTTRRHDLVVAADVFIYLGDLAPVFAGVARVLRPQGWFALSVERAPPGRDWVLLPSRRYAQGENHLRALASGHGLTVLRSEPLTLRLDQGNDVPGLLMLLAAPG